MVLGIYGGLMIFVLHENNTCHLPCHYGTKCLQYLELLSGKYGM